MKMKNKDKCIYREEKVCQDCDNRNYVAPNGCLMSHRKIIDIPKSDTECPYKITHEYHSEEARCPYCGMKNHLSEIYEYSETEVEEECGFCEKIYMVSVERIVQYNITARIKKDD